MNHHHTKFEKDRAILTCLYQQIKKAKVIMFKMDILLYTAKGINLQSLNPIGLF